MKKSDLIGRYWHELTPAEKGMLRKTRTKIGWLIKNLKQPDWCAYPNALGGQVGCWSLMDDNVIIDKKLCKSCDYLLRRTMPKIANEITPEEYAKALKKAARKKWENVFARQLEAEGYSLGEDPDNLLPGEYIREYKWHPTRRWRSDFCFTDKVLVEIEGGVWTRGRHTRGQGFINDCEKYNNAAALGWRVFRFVSGTVEDGTAIQFVKDNVFMV